MPSFRYDLLALGLGICLVPTGVLSAQPAETAPEDLVRSRLTLTARTLTVSFPPTLSADEPDHRQLLTAEAPASETRVRVGEFRSGSLLRIGTLHESTSTDEDANDSPRPRATTYDLWLTRNGSRWALEAHTSSDADDETATGGALVGTIPLARVSTADVFGTFSAALIPTSDDTGQLVLRWGAHRWTADFHFADPPEEEDEDEEEENDGEAEPAPGDGERSFDSDTSGFARAVTLLERHEAAVVLPDESRISVLFWKDVTSEHDDYSAIASVSDGEVIRLTEAAVTRLRTEVPLQFGRVTIPIDNLAPGFPGSYGLWLKWVGTGWRLVFNHEADSWGTQHDAGFDAAEIDLAYSQDGLATRPLGVALVPTSATSGQLVIHWGVHEWTADFVVTS